jgi:hypothetical protein
MGVPVLQRARDQPSRAINRLDDVLVAPALRVRAIGVQQEVTLLDATIMVD